MDDRGRCPRCAKVRYRTWDEAARAARRFGRRREVPLVPYYARHCECFHIGGPLPPVPKGPTDDIPARHD